MNFSKVLTEALREKLNRKLQ
ncbi:hypothetical protein [Lactobacillus johnsonii]